MIEVRARLETDLDGCVEALRSAHEADAYPLNWPADPHRWLTPPRLLYAGVAEVSGVIGHVAIQCLPTTESVELSRLFVVPAWRRRAVAEALVEHARTWAAQNGYDLTLTVTDEHRSAAVAFYEAGGWIHTHTSDADWNGPDGKQVRLRHYRDGRH